MKDYSIEQGQGCGGSTSLSVSCSATSTNETGQVVATRQTTCQQGFNTQTWTIVVEGETLYQGNGSDLPSSITPTQGNHAGIEILVSASNNNRTIQFEANDGFDDTLLIETSFSATDFCGNADTKSCIVSLDWAGPTAVIVQQSASEGVFTLDGTTSQPNGCPSGITSYFWEVIGRTEGVHYNFVNGTTNSSPVPEIDLTPSGQGSYTVRLTVGTSCGTDSETFPVTVASNNTTVANNDVFDSGFGFMADGTVYNLDLLANDTDPEGDNQSITHIGGQPVTPGNPIVISNVTFELQPDQTVNVSTNTAQSLTTTYSIVDDNTFPATDQASLQIVFAQVNAPSATTPDDFTTCEGSNATFSTTATPGDGGALSYQWERSINGGASFAPLSNGPNYANVTTDTLTVLNPPASFDNYQYRVKVTETPSGLTTTTVGATLDVIPNLVLSGPTNKTVDQGNAAIFMVSHGPVNPGHSVSYAWEESTDGGTIWNAITNGGDYSGANTTALTVQNPDSSKDSYQYRVKVTQTFNAVSCEYTSQSATLTVTANTTDAVDDSFAGPFVVGVSYNINPLQNDTDPEGDTINIIQIDGQAATVGNAVVVAGVGSFTLLANKTVDVTFSDAGPHTVAYTIQDDNASPATDTANMSFPDVQSVDAFVMNDLNDDPVGFVRADGSGSAITFVSLGIDKDNDNTFEGQTALPLPSGPIPNGGGGFVSPNPTPITGGTVFISQVWSDDQRLGTLLAEDRKMFPTPDISLNCTTQNAIVATSSNLSPDTVANTYKALNYAQGDDVFYVDILFDNLQGSGWGPFTNTGITVSGLSDDPLNTANMQTAFEGLGIPSGDAATMAAAITGTVGSVTVDGDVFANQFAATSLIMQTAVSHHYTDGAEMHSIRLSALHSKDSANCTLTAASPPTVSVVWDGDKTDPDNTSMTISGLKSDGVTAHDAGILYDVTITTHIGTYTVNNVQRGTPIPGGDVVNIATQTGVNILAGNVENFTYQHPALEIPTPTVGPNDELIVGSTNQYGVDIEAVANEGALVSASDTDRSFFHTYIWENGDTAAASGVSPWQPNGEDGIPTTYAGFWYVEGQTGPGTANPIGPSAAYINELDNNNHGGGGGPFNHNQHFMFVHGQDTLEIEIDGVYADAVAGASITPPVLGDSEFEQAINWAESQALGSNGAIMLIGSVNGKFVETNDPESVLFNQAMPGTIGGTNYGTTAGGGWGGYYELQNTQADLGRMRMQDPATAEYHIWVPAVYTR